MGGQVTRRRDAMRFACWRFALVVLRYSEGRGDDWKRTGILLRAGGDVVCSRCLVLADSGAVEDERGRRWW